ncbi:hypothetical protein H257_10282 [Aphanomyces astaci]|uniref:Tf2-1-like SH3-like domain-containing protein n=1 Tax=Aphanomyces astaci TaxID=112090 RepID=W4G6Z2_APHAT|nr:hypothetical protein H257_10282 [Aphanomyces astaci]ETV75440.1 hypothetical protein H257_10282 [Aphanomyces astaci]|eukprot:XP_009835074.1 hypothetical protein H257_10282 [Aphanomyces astaci]
MSTSDHPESDGQTERANVASSKISFGATPFLPVHRGLLRYSMRFSLTTPRYKRSLAFPPIMQSISNTPTSLRCSTVRSQVGVESLRGSFLLVYTPTPLAALSKPSRASSPVESRSCNISMTASLPLSSAHGRSNLASFAVGEQVSSTSPVGMSSNVELGTHGPFTVHRVVSPTNYKLDLPNSWQIHPTFYLGKLKRYLPSLSTSTTDEVTANDPLDPAAALSLPPPLPSPPPLAPQALSSATSAPALDAVPPLPALPPDNPRLLATTIALPPAQPLSAPAHLRVPTSRNSSSAKPTRSTRLAGSTENPQDVNRAPCTCAAVAIAACPRGGDRSDTAIVGSRWTATGRQFAVRVGSTTTWHLDDYIKQHLPQVRAAYLRGRQSARQTERPNAHASVAAARRN